MFSSIWRMFNVYVVTKEGLCYVTAESQTRPIWKKLSRNRMWVKNKMTHSGSVSLSVVHTSHVVPKTVFGGAQIHVIISAWLLQFMNIP